MSLCRQSGHGVGRVIATSHGLVNIYRDKQQPMMCGFRSVWADVPSDDADDPLLLGNSWLLWGIQSILWSYLLELDNELLFWGSWSNFICNSFSKGPFYLCKNSFCCFYNFKRNTYSLAKEQNYEKVERREEKAGTVKLVKLGFKFWPLSIFLALVMLFYKWHNKAL